MFKKEVKNQICNWTNLICCFELNLKVKKLWFQHKNLSFPSDLTIEGKNASQGLEYIDWEVFDESVSTVL